MLVIDGEPKSWERFGQMLMSYEGFSFKLEVYDNGEERLRYLLCNSATNPLFCNSSKTPKPR